MTEQPIPKRIDRLVVNGHVVTCDDRRATIDGGGLAICDGRIEIVAADGDLAPLKEKAASVFDARGNIVMPGLINTHCHAGDSLFRGLVENLPLEDWLQTVWKAERAILNRETTHLGAALGLAELVLGGVTTVMDMFWYPEELAEAANLIGARVSTGGIFFDFTGMDGYEADRRVADAEAFIDRFKDDPLVIPGVFPHGTYTVGPDLLKRAWQVAVDHDCLFSTHAAETRTEQRTVADQYGLSVIRHLHGLDMLAPRTVLAHCVHVDDAEIQLMAEAGTNVIHNPVSNLKLGSGIAPVPDMVAAGINLGLGTDGAISGNDLDLWLAMRLAATLHNGVRENPTAITSDIALDMVTRNGAKALGMEDRIGSLEPGKEADFILLDVDAVHCLPLFDATNHVVYAAGRSDVTDVFIGGRHVVRDRQLTGLDVDDLRREVRRLQPAIRASIED